MQKRGTQTGLQLYNLVPIYEDITGDEQVVKACLAADLPPCQGGPGEKQ